MCNIQIQKQQQPQQQNPALVGFPYTGFKGEKTLQISAKTEIFLLYRRRKVVSLFQREYNINLSRDKRSFVFCC